MPQFDPASFTSQLFWLAICFGLIYASMSKVFLPRIRDILRKRNHDIDHNNSLAFQLKDQIYEIEETTKKLREMSALQYKTALDQSTKQANLQKEEGLQNLKNQIFAMIEKSKNEIDEFRKNSQDDCQKIIKQLIDEISQKLLADTN